MCAPHCQQIESCDFNSRMIARGAKNMIIIISNG